MDEFKKGYCPRRRWMEENNETEGDLTNWDNRETTRKQRKNRAEKLSALDEQLRNLANLKLNRFEIAKVMNWTVDFTTQKLEFYGIKTRNGFKT